MLAACRHRNSAQLDSSRRGAGSIPSRRRISQAGAGRERDDEPEEFALDPPVPAARVLARQPHHQLTHVDRRPGTAGATMRTRPAARHRERRSFRHPQVASDGNQRHIDRTRNRQKHARSVATGYRGLRTKFHVSRASAVGCQPLRKIPSLRRRSRSSQDEIVLVRRNSSKRLGLAVPLSKIPIPGGVVFRGAADDRVVTPPFLWPGGPYADRALASS